jgi:hypothetical protein
MICIEIIYVECITLWFATETLTQQVHLFVAGALEEHELELSEIQQQYEDQLADLKERREDKQSRVDAAA